LVQLDLDFYRQKVGRLQN